MTDDEAKARAIAARLKTIRKLLDEESERHQTKTAMLTAELQALKGICPHPRTDFQAEPVGGEGYMYCIACGKEFH